MADYGDRIESFEYVQAIDTGGAGRTATTAAAGMIAARDRLDIGFSGLLFNRDDGIILSGGDMHIGGSLDANRHAVGIGGTLNNHSATIDAGNNLFMNIANFENLNAHYRAEERLIFEGNYTGYRFHSDPKVYLEGIDDIRKGSTSRGAWKIVYPYDIEDFYQYAVHRKIYDQFILESRPAYITSGGGMTITGSVTNNRSKMTAGTTLTVTGNLTNIRAEEAKVTRDSGRIEWTWVASAGTFGNRHERRYSYSGEYLPGPVFDWSTRDVTLFGNPVITQPNANPSADILNAIANSDTSLALSGLNSNLWGVNTAPDAKRIIESNPRFTDYRTWLSSDFMVQRLSADPQIVLKRLGDGYYEQQSIREQIVEKTGARYLDGYTTDEEQYAALMRAGVEFAKEYSLEVGVKLSAELMAQLTSDIVWLEWVTVDTPEGPVQALAPVVYLAPGQEILVASDGGIVSGREVDIKGELKNAGNILGTEKVALAGTDLDNSGSISGGLVSMAAVRDITNKGGVITGRTGVELAAGRDINIESTTYSTSTQNGSRTEIGHVGGVYITGEEGHLSMQAGRDINLKAADIDSAGTIELSAANDLNIGGVTVNYEHKTGSGGNYLHDKTSEDVGSVISSTGDMKLSAGRDVGVAGSSVFGDGEIRVEAGRDVAITEGRSESYHETKSHEENSGFFSSSTRDKHHKDYSNTAIGSELSGNTVVIESGNDFTLRGSTVAASNGVSVDAGGDIALEAAENASDSYAWEESTRSGFGASFSGGRVGISYSTTTQGSESDTGEKWHSGSMLGTEDGDATLYAEKDVSAEGSQVISGTGDIAISGEDVAITSVQDTIDSEGRDWYEQSSIGICGALGNAINSGVSAITNADRAQNAMSDRAGALYGIAAARDAYETGKAVAQMGAANSGGNNIGISAEIGFSSSESESRYESHDSSVVGSTLISGGDTTIVARGEGETEGTGNLDIIGSTIDTGGDVLLAANNDINLKSAAESSSYQDWNESSGFGIGASIGIGVGQGGAGINFGLNANMSQSDGTGSGNTAGHVETVITGENVEFASVNDTTIKGGQIVGNSVLGTVGGDLTIVSEQDVESHDRDQSSWGGGVSIGFTLGAGGPSVSGSFSSQKQNAESDYASVDEQSGILASEGGFDITVGGNTHLEGAVIASTADAEDNLLVTGTLTTDTIGNHAEYEGTTSGWGGEFTYVKNPGQGDKNANTGSISPSLPMKENGDDSSVTQSAIAEGTVVITDEEGQLAQTGQTAADVIAGLNRDTENAHQGALGRNPDLQEILDRQAELVDASAAAGRAVAKTVGDISQSMLHKTGDKEWGEGGIYKAILQGAGAALVAQLGNGQGVQAALGAISSQLASGRIVDAASTLTSNIFEDPDMQEFMKNILTGTLASAIGSAAGGETGGAAASTIDRNNRQLHEEELYTIFDLATIVTEDGLEILDMELLKKYQAAAAALIHSSAEFKEGTPEYELFSELEKFGNSDECKAEMEKLLSMQGKNPLASDAHGGIMSRPLFIYTEEDKRMDAFSYSYRYDPTAVPRK